MSLYFICTRCSRFIASGRSLSKEKSSRAIFEPKQIHSTSQGSRLSRTARKYQSLNSLPRHRRSNTSAGYQNQVPKYEPPEIRTPPGLADEPIPPLSGNVLLQPNNLFHSFSTSPSPEIRKRAAFMKSHAYCPHPSHQRTRAPISPTDPENRKSADSKDSKAPALLRFECPDCGIPAYCSEEHWADDYESHMEICDTLKQINEDDHDLRSGRFFPEFQYPGDQMEEAVVNLTNWDTYLYSREYRAINEEQSLRQVTRLLTYPVTIGSILSELSPYSLREDKRITYEGLRSFNALRYNLHPPRTGAGTTISGIRPNPPPIRVFVLGARAESSLPRDVWLQLPYLFPRVAVHLIFVGPESMANRDSEFPLPPRTPSNPFCAVVEDRISHQLKISTYVDYFHTLHTANHFHPYDPYFDCFVLFHPGLGHPASVHEWADTLPQLLETKLPIICTGYTNWDMERDRRWVEEKMAGEVDILMSPGENKFRSLRWDLNDFDPADVTCGNWGVWAFRGKRYEATMKD